MKRVYLFTLACCNLLALTGCSRMDSASEIHSQNSRNPAWKAQFKVGVRSAIADRDRGILAWEANDNGEWEAWRNLWCFRKVLKDKYGIEYRLRGNLQEFSNEGRIAGYQSVMDPIISARLGKDWKERIYKESAAYYHQNWENLERQFYIDERGQPGYDDYVSKHSISEYEHQQGQPLSTFLDYRDELR